MARLCHIRSRPRSTQRHRLLVTLAFYPVSILNMLPTASATQAPTVRPPPCTVKTLHASGFQTCVTDYDGMLRCWGMNRQPSGNYGSCYLGIGDSNNRGDTSGSMGHGLP
eukprot:Hpha_TRINITY_DN16710_c4_g2::TRINITY_DN16710_c4_g2_i3::g.77968::m.77968